MSVIDVVLYLKRKERELDYWNMFNHLSCSREVGSKPILFSLSRSRMWDTADRHIAVPLWIQSPKEANFLKNLDYQHASSSQDLYCIHVERNSTMFDPHLKEDMRMPCGTLSQTRLLDSSVVVRPLNTLPLPNRIHSNNYLTYSTRSSFSLSI